VQSGRYGRRGEDIHGVHAREFEPLTWRITMKRILAAMLLITAVAVLFGSASAQNRPGVRPNYWQQQVELKLQNVPFSEALQNLFRGTPVNYVLPSDFPSITISYVNITATRRAAFDTLCKEAPSYDYKIDGDKLTFVARQAGDKEDFLQQKIDLMDFNGSLELAMMRLLCYPGGQNTPMEYSLPEDMRNRPVTGLMRNFRRLDALNSLCDQAGIYFRREGNKLTFFPKHDGVYIENGESKVSNVSFQNTPFPQVVSSLLDLSQVSYTLMPGLDQAKVTATLKNLSLEDALKQVVQAAGATYRKEVVNGKDAYTFSPGEANASQVYTPYRPRQVFGGMGNQQQALAPDAVSDTVSLKYVDTSAVMPLANMQQGVQIANSGNKFLTVRGTPAAIKSFKDIVAQVDRPESMPRAVRVKAAVQLTVTDRAGKSQPVISKAETESVGAENMTMPLEIIAMRSANGANFEDPNHKYLQLGLSLTPTVLSPESTKVATAPPSISLNGHGLLSVDLPIKIQKQFDFAVSTAPGVGQTIAQGSVDIDASSVSFAVTLTASIEKGRVQLPANSIQGGCGVQGGYGGMGGSSYGGGTYGGYGGGSYGGGMQNQQAAPAPRFPGNPQPNPASAPPPKQTPAK
jgi:hypothetical protein